MKSSTAAPSLRNSGLEQTWNGRSGLGPRSRRAPCSAVPTGTVDLVTITLGSFMCWPIVRATASTCCRSAEPSSSGGVPTAMKTTSAVLDRGADVGGEPEPALGLVALDHAARARARRSGSRSAASRSILPRVDVGADDVVAGLGEARAGDQPDISGPDDRDLHRAACPAAARCGCPRSPRACGAISRSRARCDR